MGGLAQAYFASLDSLLHDLNGSIDLILVAQNSAETSKRRNALHVRRAKDVARCFDAGA